MDTVVAVRVEDNRIMPCPCAAVNRRHRIIACRFRGFAHDRVSTHYDLYQSVSSECGPLTAKRKHSMIEQRMMDVMDIGEQSVLVADDDDDIRGLMVAQLAQERYAVSSAATIAEIRAILTTTSVDLIVLDLNLPDGDGLTLCRELRSEGHSCAIIMVTARDGAVDRVLGLELGADDYLTKPFEPRELLARVRNLLRRHRSDVVARPRGARFARFGDWRLDLLQRRLVAPDNRLVILSSAEFRLLDRFVTAPSRVLTREMLSPERRATASYDRTIDLQISRLRQKLTDAGAPGELILTVRSEGYVFVGEISYE